MRNEQLTLNNGQSTPQRDLFVGRLVRLTAFDPETDAATVARWSWDTEYHRLADDTPAHPRLMRQVKEQLEFNIDHIFCFAIRTLADDRLIGEIDIWLESWAHGEAWTGIVIGERDDWGNGYGTEAMQLSLHYAFAELNVQRVSLSVFAYNPRAIRSYEKAGFRREGVIRGDCRRDGQRWDSVLMGILREEWLNNEQHLHLHRRQLRVVQV